MRTMRFFDMLNDYLEKESARIAAETEKRKRTVLEEFAFFLDQRKGKVWKLAEISEEDMREYYRKLRKEKTSRIEQRVQAINHFMDYAVKKGWMDKRPHHRLFEHRKGGERHFRIDEGEREKLLAHLAGWKPKKLFDQRDKAFLLIFLRYKLRKTEISGLNIEDYAEGKLAVKTPFAWRNQVIELSPEEIEAIDTYLHERCKRNEAPDDPALFIGYKRRGIAPGMVKIIAEAYLARITEKKP